MRPGPRALVPLTTHTLHTLRHTHLLPAARHRSTPTFTIRCRYQVVPFYSMDPKTSMLACIPLHLFPLHQPFQSHLLCLHGIQPWKSLTCTFTSPRQYRIPVLPVPVRVRPRAYGVPLVEHDWRAQPRGGGGQRQGLLRPVPRNNRGAAPHQGARPCAVRAVRAVSVAQALCMRPEHYWLPLRRVQPPSHSSHLPFCGPSAPLFPRSFPQADGSLCTACAQASGQRRQRGREHGMRVERALANRNDTHDYWPQPPPLPPSPLKPKESDTLSQPAPYGLLFVLLV